jgi:fructose/tagatose bisphosphate aldolase
LASLEYTFHLNVKDADVLKGIVQFFNLENKVVIIDNIKSAYIHIRKFEDIYNTILPFFENYPIQGLKHLDFLDFKQVAKQIKDKNHLTLEGYLEIIKIKSNMNQNRKW